MRKEPTGEWHVDNFSTICAVPCRTKTKFGLYKKLSGALSSVVSHIHSGFFLPQWYYSHNLMAEWNMSNEKKLAGKVAIITGGASGIGEATARLFADHGAFMVVIADIQDDLGRQVAESIGTNKCSYVHCDVTEEEQVQSLVEWTVKNFGQLDIMFSNAGVLGNSDQTILDLDLSAFDSLFAVNLRGMATCVKHAARAMVERCVRGSIVCTGSVAARVGGRKRTDYHMSKHAVLGLVRSASIQLGVHGIRVNCVSPAGVATPMTLNAHGMSAEKVESLYEQWKSLKGDVLRTRHVADAVLFLASSDSQLVTGLDLAVDGGFHVV